MMNKHDQEAVEDIITVRIVSDNCIEIIATIHVAGFIIGPKGASIRQIQQRSGVSIRSWNHITQKTSTRVFSIQGCKGGQFQVLEYMLAAVARYKELAEGQCSGMQVSCLQTVREIEFFYKPPPKGLAPTAASLK